MKLKDFPFVQGAFLEVAAENCMIRYGWEMNPEQDVPLEWVTRFVNAELTYKACSEMNLFKTIPDVLKQQDSAIMFNEKSTVLDMLIAGGDFIEFERQIPLLYDDVGAAGDLLNEFFDGELSGTFVKRR